MNPVVHLREKLPNLMFDHFLELFEIYRSKSLKLIEINFHLHYFVLFK